MKSVTILLWLTLVLAASGCDQLPQAAEGGMAETLTAMQADNQALRDDAAAAQGTRDAALARVSNLQAANAQNAEQIAALRETAVAAHDLVVGLQGTNTAQDSFISYLATRPALLITPVGPDATRTPHRPILGEIVIDDGVCCVQATAGQPQPLALTLEASGPSEVTEMRLAAGSRELTEAELEEVQWQPFQAETTINVATPLNWSTAVVSAQFRDEAGDLSRVVSAEVQIEAN